MRHNDNSKNDFETKKATDVIWNKITELDAIIQTQEPFKLVKIDPERGREIIRSLVIDLYSIARMLNSILPDTSRKIKESVKKNIMPDTLFVRKD